MARRKDALWMLRVTTRRVRDCEASLGEALARPEEVRRLELQELAEAVTSLQGAVRRGLDAFPLARERPPQVDEAA